MKIVNIEHNFKFHDMKHFLRGESGIKDELVRFQFGFDSITLTTFLLRTTTFENFQHVYMIMHTSAKQQTCCVYMVT